MQQLEHKIAQRIDYNDGTSYALVRVYLGHMETVTEDTDTTDPVGLERFIRSEKVGEFELTVPTEELEKAAADLAKEKYA